MTDDVLIKQFEQLGPDAVRMMVANGRYTSDLQMKAIGWLAQVDRDERARSEASQSLQMRTALSARNAAWIAAIAAIIAAIAAIITVVLGLMK